MKILAISDVHGEDNENLYKYLNNNDIDIVIITGDITNFGPLEFVDEFIGKILDCDCEVMAVPGNCDPAGICNAIRESDAICLHNNILSFDKIQDNKIYGDVYELLANYDFVANEEVPKVKILVTHAPPYNTGADLTESGDHVGSQGILKSIHEFQPQINICGHIHEAKSISKIGNTTDVANPGMLKDNGAVLIDVGEGADYTIDIISLDE